MLRNDPLIHFLLIGGLLFAVLSWLDQTTPVGQILVSAGRVDELARSAELLQGRPPTRAELDRLVAAAIRDEVYYREALARGLDSGDTVVRQRLIEKMRELTENLADPLPPDSDLESWFVENTGQFRIPELVTFEQVFFDPDEHGDATASVVDEALAALNSGAEPAGLGDRTPLSPRYESADEARIRTLFGEEFTTAVFAATTGNWIGPFESGFGLHLVRVDDHTAARDPAYAEVESRVRDAYEAQRLARANQQAFDEIRANFDIAVQWQAGTEPEAWP